MELLTVRGSLLLLVLLTVFDVVGTVLACKLRTVLLYDLFRLETVPVRLRIK